MAQFITAAFSRFTSVLVILVFSLFSLPLVVSQTSSGSITSKRSIALPEFSTAQPADGGQAGETLHAANLVGYTAQTLTMLASGQALNIEFVGASGVWPETAAEAGLQGEQVTYPMLWSGIDLMVFNRTGGGVTGLFKLAPFADPGQIRLKTSTDFQIEPDGSLITGLPGGVFTVSTPRAWQEIGGVRVEVPAGHIVTGSQGGSLEAIHLSAYDPAYPLVIEIEFGG